MKQPYKKTDAELVVLLIGEQSEQEEGIKCMFIDDNLRKSIISAILKLGGNRPDAKDAFQDGFRIFFRNVLRRTYLGDSSPSTYFYKICINLWKDKQKGAYRRRMSFIDDPVKMDSLHYDTPENKLEMEEQQQMVRSLLDRVKGRCRDILWLRALSYSMEEIAEKIGLSNARMATIEAYRCTERLRKSLDKTPGWHVLYKMVNFKST